MGAGFDFRVWDLGFGVYAGPYQASFPLYRSLRALMKPCQSSPHLAIQILQTLPTLPTLTLQTLQALQILQTLQTLPTLPTLPTLNPRPPDVVISFRELAWRLATESRFALLAHRIGLKLGASARRLGFPAVLVLRVRV